MELLDDAQSSHRGTPRGFEPANSSNRKGVMKKHVSRPQDLIVNLVLRRLPQEPLEDHPEILRSLAVFVDDNGLKAELADRADQAESALTSTQQLQFRHLVHANSLAS